MLRLQFAPGINDELAEQSAGVPEPATCSKLGPPTVSPVIESRTLPMLSTSTDCGLSLLVLPSFVAAKFNVGGCERWSVTTALLSPSATTRSPAPSSANAWG